MALRTSDLKISVKIVSNEHRNSIADRTRLGLRTTTYMQYCAAVRVGPFMYVAGIIGKQYRANEMTTSMMGVLDIEQRVWQWIRYVGSFEQGSGMFLYKDSLYSLGKRDHTGAESGKLSRFDLALNEWSYCHTKGPGPGSISYFSGHFLEPLSRYVVFGGYGNRLANGVYLLDIPEFLWSEALIKGTPPMGRFQHGSCVHKGVIYIYGGWHNGSRCDDGLFLLKVGRGRTATWSSPRTNAAAFGGRSSFVFTSVGRILLLSGGYWQHGLAGLACYDPDLKEFKTVNLSTDLREAIGSGACGVHVDNGQSIAILGGRSSWDHVRISVGE